MSRLKTLARLSCAARPARRAAAGLALCCGLLFPSLASAAPPCLGAAGETVRCEPVDALPVSANPAATADSEDDSSIPLPAPQTLFGLICVIGGLFALIGLMPDFDGWGTGEHEDPRRPK